MKRTTVIIAALTLWGCSEQPNSPAKPSPTTSPAPGAPTTSAAYDPSTFRADITRLISAKQYRQAVALVKAADVERQLAADRAGYMAIGLDMILLPGVYPQVEYDPSRDWYVPGTQDAIEDGEWQNAATGFAERYNLRRRGMSG
jgi:hypothetical protein